MNVSITRITGDFLFYGSLLKVCGDDASPVPAPGSILLLTTFLAGLMGFKRKLFQKPEV